MPGISLIRTALWMQGINVHERNRQANCNRQLLLDSQLVHAHNTTNSPMRCHLPTGPARASARNRQTSYMFDFMMQNKFSARVKTALAVAAFFTLTACGGDADTVADSNPVALVAGETAMGNFAEILSGVGTFDGLYAALALTGTDSML